jgi:1,4-alpha-glucan branching enzyme
MVTGTLSLLLHAHLPFVRHPEHEDSLEENWLFEAISDTYLPLLHMLERLWEDGIEFRLTMTLSPPLASMLTDPLLISRFLHRLDRLIELGEREIKRTEGQPEFSALAHRYTRRYVEARKSFLSRYQGDLVKAFKHFQDLGRIEIMATCATHGYLPLLSMDSAAVRAQIRIGLDEYRRMFGRNPKGFWLPECGYFPGVDRLLQKEGISYTLLETHGITRADPRPENGVYEPLFCPSGVAVFARDPACSRQVWSSQEGYPGDGDYREFYRDIAYDLDLEYLRPYIHRDGIRTETGYKYFRVTGRDSKKEIYIPENAMKKAESHAEDFLFSRLRQVEYLHTRMERRPIILAPYDAELFGHWWYEGPIWLEFLIRKVALKKGSLQLATPGDYLEEYPSGRVSVPSMSSWGRKGYNETWLNEKNRWIYPHLHEGALRMQRLAQAHPSADGLLREALRQAGREMLLAQASDWAFMMDQGDTAAYAAARVKRHLSRLYRIAEEIESGRIDQEWLSLVMLQDNLFPEMDYRPFS